MDVLTTIPLPRLAIAFVPVAVALAIFVRWSLSAWSGLYATVRMLLQLLAIGYALNYIFDADQPYLVLIVLLVMMGAAAWIALRPLGPRTAKRLAVAVAAIALSGIATLALVTQGVLSWNIRQRERSDRRRMSTIDGGAGPKAALRTA